MQLTNNNPFIIYSTEIRVRQQKRKIIFHGLLQSADGRRLESEIEFKILNNLANESLKGKFTNASAKGCGCSTVLPASAFAQPAQPPQSCSELLIVLKLTHGLLKAIKIIINGF